MDLDLDQCDLGSYETRRVVRVLMALVGKPEVPKKQEEVKLQVADISFLFTSNPVLSW